jgi:signal transduction histidine kinase
MLGNTLKNESSKKLVNGALVASQHLLEILNDILDIAKIEAGKLSVENTAFDLSELITSILDTNSSLATEKGIFLNAELELEQNGVFSDPVRVKQIVGNLVSNAS